MNLANYQPFIMTAVFLGIFYFLIIRPQQKRDKRVKEMRNSLKIGDNIVTIGGIYGKVIKLKDEVVTIEIGGDKTKIQIAKWAIGSVNQNEIEG